MVRSKVIIILTVNVVWPEEEGFLPSGYIISSPFHF